ncbi:MAG: cupin [Ignavibacteria bacterium RBG_13_36_8]|nr:MAG: cupin [Ignavibacteria bacterium RBG_13_36_8]
MAIKIEEPTVVESAGNKPKLIEEFIGRVNTRTSEISIARMKSPAGWIEPAQTPEFDEFTVVLKGTVHVKTADVEFDINAGEAVIVKSGEKIQYSTPYEGGAEYIAVCIPAFSLDTVHREAN